MKFRSCGEEAFRCARLSVPLDRTGVVPGKVSLFIERAQARTRKRRGVVVLFAGGPGQSASSAYPADGLGSIAKLRRTNDIVIFDQRGSGRSGLLRCPPLERANILRAGRQAGQCAATLGPRRAFYTSRDTADDLEQIRLALGAPKLSLYGVSYGTRTATSYALRYPRRVERMVLDSVVETDGSDALSLTTFAAVPRVLRTLCASSACASVTKDIVADVGRLGARLGSGRPLRGHLVDSRGRARTARLAAHDVFSSLVSGDFEPEMRRAFPTAVRSALRGDADPMLRLARRARELEGGPVKPRELSTALYAATTCEEGKLPWGRTTPFAARGGQARAAVGLLPPASLAPFDRVTVLGSDFLNLCSRWPAAAVAPVPGPGPLPDVPTLLVEGGNDLRTPLESARTVAAQLPRAKLVIVRNAGHSPLSSAIGSCVETVVSRFFRGSRLPSTCESESPERPGPAVPASFAEVPDYPGLRSGRALAAVLFTIDDIADDAGSSLIDAAGPLTGRGLRGGRYTITDKALTLRGLSYVPGVRVSGAFRAIDTKRPVAHLKVSGLRRARGVLTIRGVRFSGRLGGRRVRGSLRPGQATAASARASAARRRVAPR